MTRRTRILRPAIALVAIATLLAGCADDDAGPSGKNADAGSSQETDPTPAEGSSPSVQQVALPAGVLALPDPGAGEDSVSLEAGRYRLSLGDTLSFDVDLPAGTEANNGGLYLVADDTILKVEPAGETYGVPSEPCTGQGGITASGPTVDDLVSAIREQPIYRASRPERVEIGGAAGQYLGLRIPAAYDASSCTQGQVALPGNPGSNNNM